MTNKRLHELLEVICISTGKGACGEWYKLDFNVIREMIKDSEEIAVNNFVEFIRGKL